MLYDFSRKLSATAKLEDVVWAVAAQVASAAGKRAVVLLPSAGDLAVSGAWPPEDRLGAGEWAAARWALSHREPTGWRTGTLPNSTMQFRPLIGSEGNAVGVVGVEPDHPGENWSSEAERALAALIDQSAIAIERAELAEEIASTRAVVEGEILRSALLSSISHDLRTPLAAIIGAVTSLQGLGNRLPEHSRSDLLHTIEEEAERLNRFVGNLLDMTRLEAGVLDVKRDWVDLRDVIRAAVDRVRRVHPDHNFSTEAATEVPLVRLDPVLFEQVLVNLLDNAAKYAPPRTAVTVSTRLAGSRPVVTVNDHGPGIDAQDLPHVFEKFYRVRRGDRQPAGAAPRLDWKKVTGGLLVQDADLALQDDWKVVTKRKPTAAEMADLLFAWKVAKFVKSNAIVYAKDRATVGVGAGQMSRVNSARIAVIKAEMAGLSVQGAVVASDAFFPFADGLLAAAEAGATAIIQPGGSMRDNEVIKAADDRRLAMVMTGMRHFRH